ncbi:MAG: hypothetical protein IPO58_13985 [Betaproteobacteria bacterium]|nr:hypothetical protein [Betaproteobacteria bacterium]
MKVSLSFHAPVIALFSLLCTMDAAALPPSTPGSVDTTYGTNGVLGIGVRNGYEDAYAIVPMPDGKWLVVGSSQSAGVQDTARHLLRLEPDGRVDTSFGAGGLVYPGGPTRVAAVQASGRIIIADQYDGVGGVLKDAGLRRLLPDGSPDPGFGTGAGATILHTATPAYSTQGFNAIDLDTQGRILGGAACCLATCHRSTARSGVSAPMACPTAGSATVAV